jgi:RecA-family ATPase
MTNTGSAGAAQEPPGPVTRTYFDILDGLGYGARLVPVIPPNAPVDAWLAERYKIKDDRGKAPGIKSNGHWTLLDGWNSRTPTPENLKEWGVMGANAGILCGHDPARDETLLGLDADCLDKDLAERIEAIIVRRTGIGPKRTGLRPKALFPIRVKGAYSHPNVQFAGGQIEFLTAKQFVAMGTHPSGSAYVWDRPLVRFDALPLISPAEADGLAKDLAEALPQGQTSRGFINGEMPRQEDLLGDIDQIAEAMRHIPNDYEDRAGWANLIFALKAATVEDPERGLEIALEFSERWTGANGETNDPDYVRQTWDFNGPFRAGAQRIYSEAAKRSGGRFISPMVAQFFEEIIEAAPERGEAGQKPAVLDDSALHLIAAPDLVHIPLDPQPWIVKDMIPAAQVSILGGDGGTGKSILALQLSVAVALTGEWLGMTTARGKVLYVAAEDETKEQRRRLAAMGVDVLALEDLTIAQLADQDAVMAAATKKGDLIEATPLFKRLEAYVARTRPALVILDNLADIFGGDEIKKIHVRAFISLWRGMALRWGPAVVILQHPSVYGMTSGTGTSGNVAWSNSVRSRLLLERIMASGRPDEPKREIDPLMRRLIVKKANRSPTGGEVLLKWSEGRFVRRGGSAVNSGPPRPLQPREVVDKLVEMIRQFALEDRPLSSKPKANNFAPKACSEHESGEGVTKAQFQRALDTALAAKRVRVVRYVKNYREWEMLEAVDETVFD